MDRAIVVGSGSPVSPEIPPDPPPKAPPGPPPLADPPAPQPRPAERPPAEVPDVPTPEEIPVTDPGPTPTTPPPITSRAKSDWMFTSPALTETSPAMSANFAASLATVRPLAQSERPSFKK